MPATFLSFVLLVSPGFVLADAGDATIYEIQQGTYSNFTWVTIDSVLVTAVVGTGFWAVEPGGGAYSGIYVNRGEAPFSARGDMVTVSGYYMEDSDLSIIGATEGVGGVEDVLSSGHTLPAASSVVVGDVNSGSGTAEQWEGCLVTLDTVICTVVNAGDWLTAEDDGESPGDTLIVDDLMTYNWPVVDDVMVELTGILHYLSGNFMLEPRDNYDVLVTDTSPPGTISDLAASPGEYNGTVDLTWTATGDDGSTGTASAYVVRYSASPITDANWASATDVESEPAPQASGTPESWTAQGLPAGSTFYFAIRAEDEALQQGPTSNSPSSLVTDSVPLLTIHCINVGQGDGTLIVSGTGMTFLFDAGNNGVGNSEVVPYLDSLGITHLTYIGASHYDADHIGGIDEVMSSSVTLDSACYDRGWSYTTVTYTNYVNSISGYRETAWDGMVLDLGAGVTITCVGVNGNGQLTPPYDDTYSENDLCVNYVVSCGNFDFYVGGDTPGYASCYPYHDIESSISVDVGDVEVVRTNHHGSYCNTNNTLLSNMDPQACIVSCGDGNPYGHPKQSMLDRCTNSGAYVYLTEEGEGGTPTAGMGEVCGDVVIRTNGNCTYTVMDSTYLMDNSTDVEDAEEIVPEKFALLTNMPNPFNPTTTIRFQVPRESEINLTVHDISGREVTVLANGRHDAGVFSQVWDGRDSGGRDVASGIYFARLTADDFTATRKMVLLR